MAQTKPQLDAKDLRIAALEAALAEAQQQRAMFTLFVTKRDPKTGQGGGKLGVRCPGTNATFGMAANPTAWLNILDHAEEMRAYIEAHRAELTWERPSR